MGFLDKIKGLVKGREDQVKAGIDKVSDTAEKQGAGARREDRRSSRTRPRTSSTTWPRTRRPHPAPPRDATAAPRHTAALTRTRSVTPCHAPRAVPVAVSQPSPVSLSFTLSTASLTLPAP